MNGKKRKEIDRANCTKAIRLQKDKDKLSATVTIDRSDCIEGSLLRSLIHHWLGKSPAQTFGFLQAEVTLKFWRYWLKSQR